MALRAALSLLQGLAATAPQLLLRLAIGFLLGTDYVVSKALFDRVHTARVRGRILGLPRPAWAGGYACAYFVGVALSTLGPDAWLWMLLTSALPCLLVLPLRVTMPESPLWLANHGHAEQAAKVVRRKLGLGVAPPVQAPTLPAIHGRWRQLLSPAWRRRTLVACAFFTCQVIPTLRSAPSSRRSWRR
jgi:putative MFS transporter